MQGFRELNVAEMRQVEGGWGFLKKVWGGIKDGVRTVSRVVTGKIFGDILDKIPRLPIPRPFPCPWPR